MAGARIARSQDAADAAEFAGPEIVVGPDLGRLAESLEKTDSRTRTRAVNSHFRCGTTGRSGIRRRTSWAAHWLAGGRPRLADAANGSALPRTHQLVAPADEYIYRKAMRLRV